MPRYPRPSHEVEGDRKEVAEGSRDGNGFDLGEEEDNGFFFLGFEREATFKRLKKRERSQRYFHLFILYKRFD